MCGIIGYIGHRNVQEVLLKGLETEDMIVLELHCLVRADIFR